MKLFNTKGARSAIRDVGVVVGLTTFFLTSTHGQSTTGPHSIAVPGETFEGRVVSSELPSDLKRLIDAMRRLHEEPGLILNRKAVYAAFEVRPQKASNFKNNDGGLATVEPLIFDEPIVLPGWKANLLYARSPDAEQWWVVARFSDRGLTCYPSRLVEAYWARPFIYKPLGVHAPLFAGPHDGIPFRAEFTAPSPDSASVIFLHGRGGCLSEISASRLFNSKEYRSNDYIFDQ